MKRVIIVLLVLFCFLVSCGQEKKIPAFESYPVTISGVLTYNGVSCALTVTMREKNLLDITIDSPENLSGYRFKVDNSKVWVYYDSMQIELNGTDTDFPFSLLAQATSVSREDFEYSRTDGENRIYYYKTDGNTAVIYVKRSEDIPCRIEYTKNNTTLILDIESFIVQ